MIYRENESPLLVNHDKYKILKEANTDDIRKK